MAGGTTAQAVYVSPGPVTLQHMPNKAKMLQSNVTNIS